MGSGKKESVRRERQGKKGDGLDNVKTKGENFYRSVVEVSICRKLEEGWLTCYGCQKCQKDQDA